jgi:DNA-binding transcriptional LysR family regulator
MSILPDLHGLAIFAKVAELRSFAAAASGLKISKATVSKAVSRVETRLGTRLFHRTSRRLSLTEAGRRLAVRASAMLVEGEAAEDEALSQSAALKGLVRLAAPMSFGVLHVAPLVAEFLRLYPEVSIDLHLSDALIDFAGEGFDAAIRIAAMPDSSLVARKLCDMPVCLVAAPDYLKLHGRPTHPMHLAQHICLSYSYQLSKDTWRFRSSSGEIASVRPAGPLRVNNGDAMLPSLIAGIGLGILPEFIVRGASAEGTLEVVLKEWSLPASGVHWVTPPGGLRPKRVEALAQFLIQRLANAGKQQSAKFQ